LHELPELSVDFTSDTYAICRLTAGLLFIAWLSLLASLPVLAHPEDEFCTADSGLDPALCAALAAADSAEASDESPDGMLDEEQSAWWLFHRWFQRDWYRARVLVPASIAIGATGTWWAFQRIFM
jgi:hypothetical protein